MIQTILFDIKQLKEEEFEKALTLVTEERRNAIEKLKQPTARRLSLAAGLLLREAFIKVGRTEQISQIRKGEHGKSYLPGESFFFNVSHSGEYAVCAFGDTPVGVDLQKVKENIPKRTNRILSVAEERFLQGLPQEEARLLFYRLWARKESVIKWDGRGLRLPLEQISFVKTDLYNKEETLTDEIAFESKRLYIREYMELLPEYALCICSERNEILTDFEEMSKKILKKTKR